MRPGRRHGGSRGRPLRRVDRRARARCGRRRQARLRGRDCGRASARLSTCRARSCTRSAAPHALDDPQDLRFRASGPAHTTTREELDGTLAALARDRRRGDSHQHAVPLARTRSRRRRRRIRRYARRDAQEDSRAVGVPRAGIERAARRRRSGVSLSRSGATASSPAFSTACIPSGRRTTPPTTRSRCTTIAARSRTRRSSRGCFRSAITSRSASGSGPKVDGAALRAELDWFLPRVQAPAVSRHRVHACAKKATCSTAVSRGRGSRAIA